MLFQRIKNGLRECETDNLFQPVTRSHLKSHHYILGPSHTGGVYVYFFGVRVHGVRVSKVPPEKNGSFTESDGE
jgi:hypothetical protein